MIYCNDLTREPQIGIEPMTAFIKKHRRVAFSSRQKRNSAHEYAQEHPKRGQTLAPTGNEVATGADHCALLRNRARLLCATSVLATCGGAA